MEKKLGPLGESPKVFHSRRSKLSLGPQTPATGERIFFFKADATLGPICMEEAMSIHRLVHCLYKNSTMKYVFLMCATMYHAFICMEEAVRIQFFMLYV